MSHTCLNCGAVYEGSFCPQCAQKASIHRITFHAILHDIPHSVFHIDKGLFFTFWQMLYRPGKMMKNYIEGKRVNYFSPFAYVFLLSAVSTFVSHTSAEHIHAQNNKNLMLFPQVGLFFHHYAALMLCLLTPFISFWS